MARIKNRAQRRSDRQKQLSYASRVYAAMGYTKTEAESLALRNYKNLKKCSCWLCAHRRERDGITLQERRSLLAIHD